MYLISITIFIIRYGTGLLHNHNFSGLSDRIGKGLYCTIYIESKWHRVWFFCLFGFYFKPKFFTHIETSPSSVKPSHFDLYSTLMITEQWGHTNCNGHLQGPLTLTIATECVPVDLSLPVLTKVCHNRGSNSDLLLGEECSTILVIVASKSHIPKHYMGFVLMTKMRLFSSPEPKPQVSFSDQNLSVVRRCLCRRRRCCRKLFTFSSSSPEPLGQFQPNLAQSILG